MKRLLIMLSFIVYGITVCSAQQLNRHTYFHIGIGSGENFWSFLTFRIAANMLNVFTESNIFEHSVEYNIRSGDTEWGKMGLKHYRPFGFQSNDMFQLVKPSIKLGYVSSLQGNVNWGVYGIAEYRYEQFKVSPLKSDDDYSKQQMGRALLGGSAFVVFGGYTKGLHLMLEAGLRYNMGIDAKGVLGTNKDFNNGLTSHFAVNVSGTKMYENCGIFVDVNHFDYLKSSMCELKNVSVGVTLNFTFTQFEKK